MENLSKKISLAKRNSSISIQGAPCLFSGSFVTPIQLGGALVIAEIRRRDQKKRRKRKGSFVFLSIQIREQRNHSKMKVRKRSFSKN